MCIEQAFHSKKIDLSIAVCIHPERGFAEPRLMTMTFDYKHRMNTQQRIFPNTQSSVHFPKYTKFKMKEALALN